MNTNIVISLDTRRVRKDGTYPLVMRLGHQERTTAIPLGINLLKTDWDEEKRIVKASYRGSESVTRLNNLIQKKKANALDIILKLEEAGKLNDLALLDLKNIVINKHQSASFFDFTDNLVKELRSANRIGTATSYEGVAAILETFNSESRKLTFKQIDYKFLTKLEAQHLGKGNSYNGLAVYMRTIRAIFNKAIKVGLVDQEDYPFAKYQIKTIPTEKRALEKEYINAIINLDLPQSHKCFHARNYFLASFMMYGMNFTDMAHLKRENIVDGRIYYRRKKTSKLYDIKISENLEKILSFYLEKNKDSKYVFSIIDRADPAGQYNDIKWARKRYNKRLKDLAKLCEIEKNLTSYVSRHSFATEAMLKEVPLHAISTMLGHSSTKTTQVYLASLPNNMLDSYNERVLKEKETPYPSNKQ